MNGLGENLELVALCACLLQKVSGGGLAGEEEDLALWQAAAGDDCSFDAGHAGHDDIADEHVGLELFDGLDGLFAPEHGTRVEASLVENDCERIGNDLLVVGDEDSRL